MRKIGLLALFFSPLLVSGDTGVRGTVIDPSQRPIEGARVECGNEIHSTDTEGRFAFRESRGCDARISFPGFIAQTVPIAAGGEHRIVLAIAGVTEELVVSATRADVDASQAGISASRIDSNDLDTRRFPVLLDFLRDLPGLAVVKTGRYGGETDLFTRGGDSTGTLVLLDGIPLTDPGGQIDLAPISSADIDHVEVIRGPESTLFGAEAASGVIQIFSRRGDPESTVPHGSLTYERGSFQTDHWSANLNGGLLGRMDYSLGVDQFHSAGEFQNDAYRNTTGTANVGFRLAPSTGLRAIFREHDSFLGTPGQTAYGLFTLGANEEDRDTALGLRLDDARGTRYIQTVSWSYHRQRDRFNDSLGGGPYNVAALLRVVTGPAQRVYLDRLVDPAFPPAEVPPGEQLVVENNYTLYPFPSVSLADRELFDYQGTVAHSGGALIFGYDYERQAGIVSGTNVTRNNNGFFVHEQRSLTRRIFLTGGARLEQSSVFGTKFTPRGSASFVLTGQHGKLDSTLFRASAGLGITEPTLLESFARETFYVGNPVLRPAKTVSYEAGIVQEWFHRRVRTEADAFRNSFTDLIAYDSSVYPGTWRNLQASWARGVEASVTARITSHLSVTGAYTRLFTKITSSTTPDSAATGIGEELLRRPGNAGAISATFSTRRLSLAAGGRFAGERQDSDFLFGITRNPAYQNVYFSGSFRAAPHLAPFLRIENALNENYQEVLGFNSLSRAVNGGVRVSW